MLYVIFFIATNFKFNDLQSYKQVIHKLVGRKLEVMNTQYLTLIKPNRYMCRNGYQSIVDQGLNLTVIQLRFKQLYNYFLKVIHRRKRIVVT